MASTLLRLTRLATLAAPPLLWAAVAMAQMSDQPRLRQPAPQSIVPQEQERAQTEPDKSQVATDRKFREIDRRLKRTLRSVCAGC